MPPSNGFAFRPSLPTGQIPTAVATGDFNSDGKLDWAISNGMDDSIWLYFGNGDGTAALPTILPTAGVGPTWLIATDLNGDGKPDLVVAEADSLTVGVFLGNGDGSFQTEARYAVPAPPLFVLAGDFTGDSKLDIAVGMIGTTATGSVAVLPGDGQGHLGAALYTADPNPSVGYWLNAADLRGNGKLDLIVIDPDDFGPHGGAQIYLNNGNGTFSVGQLFFANVPSPYGPPDLALSAAVSDLNNDGCLDIVMTDSIGLAYVFSGKCDGTVATPTVQYAVGDIGATIQLQDVNGDGILDIVTSGAFLSGSGGPGLGAVAGDEVSILLGDGTGHFGMGRTYRGDMDIYSLAIGDVNGDGFPDLITANQGSNTATVFLNDGKGGFGDPQGEAFGNSTGNSNAPDSPFTFADVDGNGMLDMVVIDNPPYAGDAEQIVTFLNDGTGKFSAPIITPAWEAYTNLLPGSVTLADFRNTGKPDLLVVAGDFSPPFIFFAPNIGGGQFGSYTMTTPPGANGPMTIGDFNGDGKLDFVTVTTSTNTGEPQTFNVFLGNGDGTFQAGQSLTFETDNLFASPMFLSAGDFNRDGKLDVLVWDGGLYEFFGNGDGTFQAGRPLFTTLGGASFTGGYVMADFNRDGWPDLMTATDDYGNATDTIRSVFLGQPDGSFQYSASYSPTLYYSYNGPTLYGPYAPLNSFPGVVGDFNGDGNPDVALFPYADPSSPQATNLQILYGNGDGTFTPSFVTYPLGKRYVPQFAVDLNGDGLADLIELDNYTASFNVVKSVPSGPALQLEMLTTPVTGSTGDGRVILNTPSATATTVTLTASSSGIVLPSVAVPAGAVSQDFQFSDGSGFNQKSVFSIQAQVGSATATAFDYVSTPPLPVMEFQPAGLVFDGVAYGGAGVTKTVTLTNDGAGSLTVSSIFVSPPFSETDNCGSGLAPGASCTLQVTYTSPSPGSLISDLVVYDTVSNISHGISLEGIGIWPLQISPCCLGFSEVVGGTSPPQVLTLSNVGVVPIQVSSVLPTGAGIMQTNTCSTIAVGGKCQINVTFSPTTEGPVIGTLALNTNVPNTTAFIVPVSGNVSDFSLGTAMSQTVNPGGSASYNLTMTGSGGFSGSVNLSCGAEAGSSIGCTIKPSSVSLTVDGTSTYVVTLTTSAGSKGAVLRPAIPNAEKHERLFGAILWMPIVSFVLGCPRARRFGKNIIAATVLCLGFLLLSCGGGGGGTGGNSATPPGTYTLTVTGAVGSVSHTTSVILIVQ